MKLSDSQGTHQLWGLEQVPLSLLALTSLFIKRFGRDNLTHSLILPKSSHRNTSESLLQIKGELHKKIHSLERFSVVYHNYHLRLLLRGVVKKFTK